MFFLHFEVVQWAILEINGTPPGEEQAYFFRGKLKEFPYLEIHMRPLGFCPF